MKILKFEDLQDNDKKNIKLFLYSNPLVGKTTFAATWPKPLIVSTDGNIKGLHNINKDVNAVIIGDNVERETTSGTVIQESGWITFKNLVNNIDKLADYDTIVVDLIKDIYDYCRAYVLKKLGMEHESEEKRIGRVWNLLDSEFLPVLRKLMTSDKNVILIAHAKERDGIGVIPNLIDSVTTKIVSYSDVVARMIATPSVTNSEEIKRVLITRVQQGQLSGNRINIPSNIEDPTYDKIIKGEN